MQGHLSHTIHVLVSVEDCYHLMNHFTLQDSRVLTFLREKKKKTFSYAKVT